MKHKILALSVGLLAANAFPAYIDFTSSQFAPADGQVSFSTTVNGLGVTLTASPSGAVLFWDGVAADDGADGFGITNDNLTSTPTVGYEADEIDGREQLLVHFSQSIFVESVNLTDLFRETRDGYTYNEYGYYSIDNGATWTKVTADNSALAWPTTNGEKIVAINGNVQNILFKAPGKIDMGTYVQDHEFSVAGVNYRAVPEPATLALFGIGLLSVAGFRRFRRR